MPKSRSIIRYSALCSTRLFPLHQTRQQLLQVLHQSADLRCPTNYPSVTLVWQAHVRVRTIVAAVTTWDMYLKQPVSIFIHGGIPILFILCAVVCHQFLLFIGVRTTDS